MSFYRLCVCVSLYDVRLFYFLRLYEWNSWVYTQRKWLLLRDNCFLEPRLPSVLISCYCCVIFVSVLLLLLVDPRRKDVSSAKVRGRSLTVISFTLLLFLDRKMTLIQERSWWNERDTFSEWTLTDFYFYRENLPSSQGTVSLHTKKVVDVIDWKGKTNERESNSTKRWPRFVGESGWYQLLLVLSLLWTK